MKERIESQFHELTEIEIKAHVDTINSDPEKYVEMGAASIMAIKRCRAILKTILEGIKK